MPRPRGIGQAELEILQYITDHHPRTVGQVAEHMAKARGLARTTVQTVMDRLRTKGHLSRRKVGGVYQYSPGVSKSALLRKLVHEFVEHTLRGSHAPFVAYLAQDAKLSDDELKELHQVLREVGARRKERRT